MSTPQNFRFDFTVFLSAASDAVIPTMKQTVRIGREPQVLQPQFSHAGPVLCLHVLSHQQTGLQCLEHAGWTAELRYDDGSIYFLVMNLNQSSYVKLLLMKGKRSLKKLTYSKTKTRKSISRTSSSRGA